MKLFSFGGGAKKRPGPAMPSPTERVVTLSSQGLSEPEIIQTLRQEGYTPMQVDTAMREALRGAASGAPSQPSRPSQAYVPGEYAQPQREYAPTYGPPARRPPPMGMPERPQYDELAGEDEEDEYQPPPRLQPEPPAGPPQPPLDFEDFKRQNKELGFPDLPERGQEPEDEEVRPISRFPVRGSRMEMRNDKRRAIEELTEGVVEEKWSDFKRRVDDMNDKFQQLSDRITALEQRLGQAQGERKSGVQEVEDKIDSYKQTMNEVESRMESVERAMKDSLTPMMETLRSLSDTIKSLKDKK